MLHGACVGREAGARNRAFFRVKWLRSDCDGCIKVAWRHGCSRNTIVFCRWTLSIVLEWLHEVCDSDLSGDFLNFGAGDFPF